MRAADTIAPPGISRTILELAAIGAVLKLLLTVAPRFQIAAPKAPPREKPDTEARTETPAAEVAKSGPVLLEKAV